jgi:hypothetical protein
MKHLKLRTSSTCVTRDSKKLGIWNGIMYVSMWRNWKTLFEFEFEFYCEQEGIIEDAVERIMIEDNGVDSSDESSDTSESRVLSGVEELEDD